MAQAETQAPAKAAAHFTLTGVVRSARSYSDNYGERRHATLIATPPGPTGAGRGLFEVFSAQPLGQVGGLVDVPVRVVGTPHSYKMTDEHTGERRTVQTARHHLAAVQ